MTIGRDISYVLREHDPFISLIQARVIKRETENANLAQLSGLRGVEKKQSSISRIVRVKSVGMSGTQGRPLKNVPTISILSFLFLRCYSMHQVPLTF